MPPQLEDVGDMEYLGSVEGVEDVGEDAPSVILSKLMDVMTRRLERLLAEQDERGSKLFDELFDGRCREVALTHSDVTAVDSVDAVKRIPVPVKRRKRATESVTRVRRRKRATESVTRSRVRRRKRATESVTRLRRRKRATESVTRP